MCSSPSKKYEKILGDDDLRTGSFTMVKYIQAHYPLESDLRLL